MKKLLFFIFPLLILLCKNGIAQPSSFAKLTSLSLGVDTTRKTKILKPEDYSILMEKIKSLLTINGISSGERGQFIISPVFNVISTKSTGGGMRNILITQCNLSLNVKGRNNNSIFNSQTFYLTGSGYNNEEAILNALNNFDENGKNASDFIIASKDKILNFYNLNCKNIIQKANSYFLRQNYVSAFQEVIQIPNESNCDRKDIDLLIYKYYTSYQAQNCIKYLSKAKIYANNGKYDSSMETLDSIEPATACQNEYKKTVEYIISKIDKANDQKYKLDFMKYKDSTSSYNRTLKIMERMINLGAINTNKSAIIVR